MDIEKTIQKYALQNAVKFKGKANPGNVVPKILGEDPSQKANMKTLMPLVNSIVAQVNTMSLEDQTKKLLEIAPELLEKKDTHRDELKDLDDVDLSKGVIMRFAPSPSGPMHIGHAITGGLTSLYVKKYGGKFILRIEDTNSDNIDSDAYKMLPTDGQWIFGNVSEVWIQSDRLNIYYDYAKKMINLNVAYVCTCSQEQFKAHSDKMEDCPCRNISVEENLKRWERMFDKVHGFMEGDVVMRFKSGMQDNNPAMRDFPLMRINDTPHPRQGTNFRVWPLMNLAVTVDDIESKMTHIIRAKDHMDNAKRQEKMYKALGLGDIYPKTYFTARYNFEGLEISCSKTKAKIKEGQFWGWDDIRIPFMQALKRRGYQPGALLKYAKMNGLSQTDKTVSAEEFFKTINAFNTEILDPIAKRLFFVHDYSNIKIEGAPSRTIELKAHPDNPELGVRKLDVNDNFIVQNSDLKEMIPGEMYRLMDCVNLVFKDGKYHFHSTEYEKYKSVGKKIMHFLPKDGNYQAEIMMPDEKATVIKGMIEKSVSAVKVGECVQMERFGFCRLDSIEEKEGHKIYKFWYTHK